MNNENLQGLFDEFESARIGVYALSEARLRTASEFEKASLDRAMRETVAAMHDCGVELMIALGNSIESARKDA